MACRSMQNNRCKNLVTLSLKDEMDEYSVTRYINELYKRNKSFKREKLEMSMSALEECLQYYMQSCRSAWLCRLQRWVWRILKLC